MLAAWIGQIVTFSVVFVCGLVVVIRLARWSSYRFVTYYGQSWGEVVAFSVITILLEIGMSSC